MILETNYNEYVVVEFLQDFAESPITQGTQLAAKCTRKMLSPGHFQLHTYRQQDPYFFISGTAEHILLLVKFLEKKTINNRLS